MKMLKAELLSMAMTSFQSSIGTGPSANPGAVGRLQRSLASSADRASQAQIPEIGIVGASDLDAVGLLTGPFKGYVPIIKTAGGMAYGSLAYNVSQDKKPMWSMEAIRGHQGGGPGERNPRYNRYIPAGTPVAIFEGNPNQGGGISTGFVRGGYSQQERDLHSFNNFNVTVIHRTGPGGGPPYTVAFDETWPANSPLPPNYRFYPETTPDPRRGYNGDHQQLFNVKPYAGPYQDILTDDSYWTGTASDPGTWTDPTWRWFDYAPRLEDD